MNKYNSKTLSKSISQKKENKPSVFLDLFEVNETNSQNAKSILFGDISLKNSNNLKNGWHLVNGFSIQAKTLKKTARPLQIFNPPIDGLIKYLSSYLFKGIGLVVATKIIENYGISTLNILSEDVSVVQKKFQLNAIHAKVLTETWVQNKNTALFDIFLNELLFSPQQQKYIKNEYGIALLYTLRTNPSSLLGDIPLITFPDIEILCQRLQFNLSDQQKIIAATNYCLGKFEILRGDTCTPMERLIKEIHKHVLVDLEMIEDTIDNHKNLFKCFERKNKKVVSTESSYARDKKIISEIQRIQNTNQIAKKGKIFLKKDLKLTNDVDLSEEQTNAINSAINSPVSIITGGPGAGKTTMVKGLVSGLKLLKLELKITAPTGKAAKRISAEGLQSHSPSTIHSYLGKFGDKTDKIYDFMIVDEASMIDINLMQELLESIPDKTSIVFIGDADQLPPVGPGQVFKDLVETEKIPVVKLTGNYRQHLMSDISKAARSIVKGKVPDLTDKYFDKEFSFIETPREYQANKILDLYLYQLPKLLNVEMDQIQILSPMRDGEVGVNNLNHLIQQKLTANRSPLFAKKSKNKDIYFYADDKVIMRKNKVKELGLVNGDIGVLIRKSGNEIITEFENKGEVKFKLNQIYDLELAYAITIHLSQGSEYPGVIIPCSAEHDFMLRKNLIYTAVTRGKKRVCLVGEEKSFIAAIGKGWMDFRYTNLVELFKNV